MGFGTMNVDSDSITTAKLYSAEHSIDSGRDFDHRQDAAAFVDAIVASPWWRLHVPYEVDVEVAVIPSPATDEAGNREPRAHAGPIGDGDRIGRRTSWALVIDPLMLNEMVVLHELAHCVAPRRVPSSDLTGESPQHQQALGHGPGFVAIYAELVREFAEVAAYDDFREALDHFEVPRMTLDEYQAAVAESLGAEAAEIGRFRELERHPAEGAGGGGETLVDKPTAFSSRTLHDEMAWGELLRFEREHVRDQGTRILRRSPRISQDRLAALVSLVEPCTRDQVSRIERSEEPPSHPRLRRIAMCMAVALDVDPIYIRRRIGLTRATCGVELDELTLINPAWVARVEKFQAQSAARPARWKTDRGTENAVPRPSGTGQPANAPEN